jgi:hypothetical protein
MPVQVAINTTTTNNNNKTSKSTNKKVPKTFKDDLVGSPGKSSACTGPFDIAVVNFLPGLLTDSVFFEMGWLLLVDVIDLFVRSIDELVAVFLTDGSPESVGNSSLNII